MNKDFIIVEDLKDLGSETTKDYTLHALCLFGKATFMYNGEPMELCPGDLFIVREQHFVSQLTTSNDFKIKGIYISCNYSAFYSLKNAENTMRQISVTSILGGHLLVIGVYILAYNMLNLH